MRQFIWRSCTRKCTYFQEDCVPKRRCFCWRAWACSIFLEKVPPAGLLQVVDSSRGGKNVRLAPLMDMTFLLWQLLALTRDWCSDWVTTGILHFRLFLQSPTGACVWRRTRMANNKAYSKVEEAGSPVEGGGEHGVEMESSMYVFATDLQEMKEHLASPQTRTKEDRNIRQVSTMLYLFGKHMVKESWEDGMSGLQQQSADVFTIVVVWGQCWIFRKTGTKASKLWTWGLGMNEMLGGVWKGGLVPTVCAYFRTFSVQHPIF